MVSPQVSVIFRPCIMQYLIMRNAIGSARFLPTLFLPTGTKFGYTPEELKWKYSHWDCCLASLLS